MEFLRTLSQKNVNISAQGVRILDLKPVLETLVNSTKNLRTRKWDLTERYLSKKALKLTDAEKTQTFENFLRGRSRQDLTETCLGHLGPSLNHPRSWFSLTILFDPRWLQENRAEGSRFESPDGHFSIFFFNSALNQICSVKYPNRFWIKTTANSLKKLPRISKST
jgi:hypothetical protein